MSKMFPCLKHFHEGVDIVVQQVMCLPVTTTSYMCASLNLVVLHLIKLSTYVLGKAEDDSSDTWDPVTHTGDPDGIIGSWLWSCME